MLKILWVRTLEAAMVGGSGSVFHEAGVRLSGGSVVNWRLDWGFPRCQFPTCWLMDFPGGSDGKASVYNVGDQGSISRTRLSDFTFTFCWLKSPFLRKHRAAWVSSWRITDSQSEWWGKRVRGRDRKWSAFYNFNLGNEIPAFLLYSTWIKEASQVNGKGDYTKMWILRSRDHWRDLGKWMLQSQWRTNQWRNSRKPER